MWISWLWKAGTTCNRCFPSEGFNYFVSYLLCCVREKLGCRKGGSAHDDMWSFATWRYLIIMTCLFSVVDTTHLLNRHVCRRQLTGAPYKGIHRVTWFSQQICEQARLRSTCHHNNWREDREKLAIGARDRWGMLMSINDKVDERSVNWCGFTRPWNKLVKQCVERQTVTTRSSHDDALAGLHNSICIYDWGHADLTLINAALINAQREVSIIQMQWTLHQAWNMHTIHCTRIVHPR